MRKTFIFIGFFALIAAGCGGGGGEELSESTRGGPGRIALPEPSPGSGSQAWSDSDEYRDSNGLRLINAAEGYATRTTGEPGGRGKKVAVLDSVVDVSHSDLSGVTFKFAQDVPDVNKESHGTHVAGTIAARRDGHGMHGVAYNAGLVGISVFRTVERQRGTYIPTLDFSADAAAAIASAAGLRRTYPVWDALGNPVYTQNAFGFPVQETRISQPAASADVMNMSFRAADPFGQILNAMRDAAGAGRIMVAALGNEGQTGPADAPATHMARSGIAGLGIAVGALNEAGTGRANFSNTCSGVQNYCLFAPGSGILSTVAGDQYERKSGTSMASPHVAGAAAVVWAAFPNKSGSQIVGRLLTTARPLDGQEISRTFGHGALDLGAALNPVGFLSLSVPGAGTVPLSSSVVDLPPGFGATPEGLGFANAIVYDEQVFPFRYDLNGAFRTHETASTGYLRYWLSSIGPQSSVVPIGPTNFLQFVHDEEVAFGSADDIFGSVSSFGSINESRSGEEGGAVHGFRAHLQPLSNLSLVVGDIGNATGASNRRASERIGGMLIHDDLSISPYAAFAGHGVGVNVEWQLDDNLTMDFAGKEGAGYFGSTNARLASIGFTRSSGDTVTMGARYGTLWERGSRVGVRAGGAFEGIRGATTQFVDLGAEAQLSDRAVLFGSVSRGLTGEDSPEPGSLVVNWSGVKATSAMLGAEFGRVWRSTDRLVVTASLPFRVHQGSVAVDVPHEEIADGVTAFMTETVDLVPEGREKKVQVVYETGNERPVAAAFGAYLRIEPDHDASADPDFGVGGKLRVSF